MVWAPFWIFWKEQGWRGVLFSHNKSFTKRKSVVVVVTKLWSNIHWQFKGWGHIHHQRRMYDGPGRSRSCSDRTPQDLQARWSSSYEYHSGTNGKLNRLHPSSMLGFSRNCLIISCYFKPLWWMVSANRSLLYEKKSDYHPNLTSRSSVLPITIQIHFLAHSHHIATEKR